MSLLPTLLKCSSTPFPARSTLQLPRLQIVRWRKPRWVPKAPSKRFIVRQPTPKDPEETAKLFEWHRLYNTEMKSVRKYLHDNKALWTEETESVGQKALSEQEWREIAAEFEAWNLQGAKLSEESKQQTAKRDEKLRQRIVEQEQRERLEMMEAAEARIQKEKAAAANFITEDNLDETIEQLLKTRTHYDFAIYSDHGVANRNEYIKGVKDTKPVTYTVPDEQDMTEDVPVVEAMGNETEDTTDKRN